MKLTAAQLTSTVRGEIADPDLEPSTVLRRLTIHSDATTENGLFAALSGATDGHDYVAEASIQGNVAHLCSDSTCTRYGAIRVTDQAQALLELARTVRATTTAQVVAITGSVGKTSTKDMLASIGSVSLHTAFSPGSYNNEIGLPYTVLNAPDSCDLVVLEHGARHTGDIAHLCTISKPSVGIVTRVAPAHLGIFGSIEAIAEAKSELPQALPSNGYAILNADDSRVAAMSSKTSATVITFGCENGDIQAKNIALDQNLLASFELVSPWGNAQIKLSVPGQHMIVNALAAASASLALGISLSDIQIGLSRATISAMRMAIGRTNSGATIINDCYNANEESMKAALHALATKNATRRVAFLGQMAELGEAEEHTHREIVEFAKERGIEVRSVESPLYGLEVISIDEAREELAQLSSDDAALIKGSRAAQLERIATGLVE